MRVFLLLHEFHLHDKINVSVCKTILSIRIKTLEVKHVLYIMFQNFNNKNYLKIYSSKNSSETGISIKKC